MRAKSSVMQETQKTVRFNKKKKNGKKLKEQREKKKLYIKKLAGKCCQLYKCFVKRQKRAQYLVKLPKRHQVLTQHKMRCATTFKRNWYIEWLIPSNQFKCKEKWAAFVTVWHSLFPMRNYANWFVRISMGLWTFSFCLMFFFLFSFMLDIPLITINNRAVNTNLAKYALCNTESVYTELTEYNEKKATVKWVSEHWHSLTWHSFSPFT